MSETQLFLSVGWTLGIKYRTHVNITHRSTDIYMPSEKVVKLGNTC
jgi:hypothetical protein